MPNEPWPTAITKIEPNKVQLRGYPIDQLMGEISYAQAVYLALKGELPDASTGKLIEAMLVSSVDGRAGVCCHGDPAVQLDVGDLKMRTIEDVWKGPEIERIRRVHFKRSWKELPLCERCDMTCPYTRWVRHYFSTYRRILTG